MAQSSFTVTSLGRLFKVEERTTDAVMISFSISSPFLQYTLEDGAMFRIDRIISALCFLQVRLSIRRNDKVLCSLVQFSSRALFLQL